MENEIQNVQGSEKFDLRKITKKVSYFYLGVFALFLLFFLTPLIMFGPFFDNIGGSIIWYSFLVMSVVVFVLAFLDFRKRPWSVGPVLAWSVSVLVLFLYGGNFKFAALFVGLPYSVVSLSDKGMATRLFSWLVIIAFIFVGMIMLAPRFF